MEDSTPMMPARQPHNLCSRSLHTMEYLPHLGWYCEQCEQEADAHELDLRSRGYEV